MDSHLLSLITFAPIAGAFALLFIPGREKTILKTTAIVVSGVGLAASVYMLAAYDPSTSELQFVEKIDWIPAFGITYFMAADGLSVPMIVLTTLLSFVSLIASWKIDEGVKGYFALFLLLQASMAVVVCAQDLLLFYVWWELMLLPMYFLIGIWGGPEREYAAIKFFLYTLAGSVLMLVAIIWMYFDVDPHTFDMTVLAAKAPWDPRTAMILWVLLFIGFAIKIPMFPFHTWLPIAHVEAPTAVSVILAGVLLKMGTYGILRVNYAILPGATMEAAGVMAVFGLVNILYGAFCAMAQSDMKRLVAYSSVSHMGYCLLGMASMTPEGIDGAYLQMISHGLITAMLFLLVGVIYDRAHHREIDKFGGLATLMPVYTGFVTVAFFASLGLPGLSGFIAEALTLLGAWASPMTRPLVYGALLGIVITAAYHLWMIQRAFLGPVNERYRGIAEIDGREIACLVPLLVLVIVIGVWPAPTVRLFDETLRVLVRTVASAG